MNEYQVRVYFASGRMSYNIGTLIKGDYNSSKLVFDFDDDTGIKMFELLKPDGETKWVKEIVSNEIVLADTDVLGEVIPLLTQEGTYIFEVAKYDGNSKLTSVKGKFKVKDEQVSTSDIPIEEVSKVELDDLINDVAKVVEEGTEATANTIEQANYAKAQGDYAKEQAQIIIDANTTAAKIINDFETNVNEYTTDFNDNAEEKLEAYNQNDIDKTNAYNENAESKVNSYNENASNKLKEYNDNATTKLSEYNSNSETKTTAFNTNASEKTGAFNLNVTEKTTDFDSNVEAKTTEFNSNATTKTEEYNANAEAKVNEFNTNVDDLMQDVEDCYNNMLTNEVEGTSIHVEDSANARVLELKIDGNSYQEVRSGKNLLSEVVDKTTKTLNGITLTFLNNNKINLTGTSTATATFDLPLKETVKMSKNIYVHIRNNSLNSNGAIAFIGNGVQRGWTSFGEINKISNLLGISTDEFEIDTLRFQINTGQTIDITLQPSLEYTSTATEYEQYGASPSPDYPQEVEVIEAYNLFDKDNVVFKKGYILDDNGVEISSAMSGYTTTFIEVKPNTMYTIQGKLCGSLSNIRLYYYDKDKKWLKRSDTILYNAIPYSFTTENNVYYIQIQAVTDDYDSSTVQINKGNIKPYTPYGCVKNKFVGKNLFDYTDGFNSSIAGLTNTINEDGSITVSGVPTYSWVHIVQRKKINHLLENGQKYTISQSDTSSQALVFIEIMTTDKTTGIANSYKRNATITVDLDKYDYSVGLYTNLTTAWGNDTRTITGFYQLEKGPVATEFEPYQENNLDVNLQENFKGKIGDIADTLRVEHGRAILTKRIGKVILDGSDDENWHYESTSKWPFRLSVPDIKPFNNSSGSTIIPNIKSTHFISTYWNMNPNNYMMTGMADIPKMISFADNKYNSLEDFKVGLSENPVTVYYILAEPYEVDLGLVNMPKTFEGVTNISMIANLESNMKLKYVRSTNIVVENLAKAIVAMGGEV